MAYSELSEGLPYVILRLALSGIVKGEASNMKEPENNIACRHALAFPDDRSPVGIVICNFRLNDAT